MLEAEQIKENWEKILDIIKTEFNGERQERLLEMYEFFEDRMIMMPASNKVYFHSCYPGGYIHHVLNVIEAGKKVDEMWTGLGGEKDYTDEELLFVALNHDLGKVGDVKNQYYHEVEETWKLQRGQRYDVMSDKLQYMKTDQRSLYLLQHFGIKTTHNEYLGILLHEWLYDEGNKPYIINYAPEMKLQSNLPRIIHIADLLSTQLEYEEWKASSDKEGEKITKAKKKINQSLKKQDKLTDIGKQNPDASSNLASSFNDLFGNALDYLEKKDKEKGE